MGVFTMPSLGADMESGRIVEWLVQPGDKVHRGDVVAVVDTTKAAIEVEVFEDGTVTELLVEPGTEVEVGTPLATIATEDGEPGKGDDSGSEPEPDHVRSRRFVHEVREADSGRPGEPDETEGMSKEPKRRHHGHPISRTVTPPVRHLAHQLGVNLESLSGSGPHGKITRDDVQAAAPSADQADAGSERAEPRVPEPAAQRVHPTESPESKSQPERGGEVGPESVAPASRERLLVTPRARRLAATHGLDLTSVTGTGADGAVTGPDVERAATAEEAGKSADEPREGRTVAGTGAGGSQEAADEPEGGRTVSGTGSEATRAVTRAAAKIARGADRKASRRAATAALMARSAREIPHYYVSQTIDITLALDWLRSHNAERPVRERVLPAALFLRATVLAAQEVAELNGHWVDDTFVPADGVQLGVAVAMRDGGLLTPAILDAHLLDLDELMARLADLVRRARSGRLRSREIEPGSITVSSLADRGPDALFGVIYPPQVALVGIGGVVERPWAVNGALTVRSTVTLTVAADHRATDGRDGADFLAALSSALTRPEDL